MKIDCIEHNTASIMIFNMMCTKAEELGIPDDVMKAFNMQHGDNNVDVKLTVNGVEVDPIKCLEDCWKQLNSNFHDRAANLAREMVTLAGLSNLQDKLSIAEYEIGKAIDDVLIKIKGM